MLVFAHRCRGFGHPENSIRAVRSALLSPAEGVEVDIRLTKDRKWVAIHSPHFKSERNAVQRIREHTYAQVRREVVTLDAIVALHAALAPEKYLMIDVKDVGETRQLVKIIRRHGLHGNVIVISWLPEVLTRVHAADPTIKIGLSYVPIHERLKRFQATGSIEKGRYNEMHSFDIRFPIGQSQEFKSEIPDLPLYSVQVNALFCSSRLVERAHARGILVFAFTVNRTLTRTLMARRNVDGFLTDYPASR